MKFLVSLLIILTFAGHTKAQEDPVPETKAKKEKIENRHEINVGFANLLTRAVPQLYWSYYLDYGDYYNWPYGYPYSSTYFGNNRYGVGYKYHFKKGAIRTIVDFGFNNSSHTNDDQNDTIWITSSEGKFSSTSISSRIGYEFHKDMKKWQFIFGIDGIISWVDYQEESKSEVDYLFTTPYTQKYSYKTSSQTTAFGGGAVLGVKYKITDFISVSTETRFDFLNFTTNNSSESRNENSLTPGVTNNKSDYETKGNTSTISPLGLISLNIHL